ncbi:hypothetical protein C1H46_036526 [Malus baccata]|uniref:Uncharacterized protein n=1 Tax=Malus baccata TaxID=106549 RepID=A0A540KUL6_MALBA|nr:hypothetical protein C1H46_036526 [Malus baccata]
MAAARLLRTLKPMTFHSSSSSSSSPSSTALKCSSMAGRLNGGKKLTRTDNDSHQRKKKHTVAVKVSKTTSAEPQVENQGGLLVDLASLVGKATRALPVLLRTALKPKSLRQQVQMFIERGIIDCRFFTLLAVAGSLLGSVLCFVEGCFIVLESYFVYFHALSHKTDQGHMVHLLIEAIDMFLVGTAMLIFAVGLYAMFVGSKAARGKGPQFSDSNLFGLFYMKAPPAWVNMESVSQAKSKIGHAVVMILQVGLLDKFKGIPLVTPLDLACFAGAVLLSSAGIFLLSRLSTTKRSADTDRDGVRILTQEEPKVSP